MKRQNIKIILRSLGIVAGGSVMAALTIAVVYGVFWLLKMISMGMLAVCDLIISFIAASWASSLVIIGALAIGVIELELILNRKNNSTSKSNSSKSNKN